MKKCECSGCTASAKPTHLEFRQSRNICATETAVAVSGGCTTACDCGHEHDQNHHEQDRKGHDHGHDNGELTTMRQDVISIAAAVVLAAVSYLLQDGSLFCTTLRIAAILVVGLPIFIEGVKNIIKLDLEEMALMTIAVVAATIIGELPEALLVTLLFRVGNLLEGLAVSRSRREVEAITKIIPDNANLVAADGSSSVISAKLLPIGSKILIKSGERVPVDCIVLGGASSMDASSLTGESAPREVGAGDAILSGMVNQGGVLTCKTTSTFDNSTASKIVEMVKDSAAKKGRTEKMISRFARVYTPIVIAVAVVVAVLPALLGFGTFTQWISRSLVFLVASCPCALVISIPLSFFAGIGASSKNGILIKGSKYMEAIAGVQRVVFDKTGTLTTGKLSVSGVNPLPGVEEEELLRLAALCESYSNHPIAGAVVEAYGVPNTSDVAGCEEITSFGMRASIGGDDVLCGSARLMEKFGVDVSALPAANVFVAKNGNAIGSISVFDRPREDAADTIRQLKALGVTQTVMLTGDSREAAEKTGELIGIDRISAELLPGDKVSAFGEIKSTATGKVLFVGDGINDSPVLARADAGVAMGLGSDAAIEAADVVLLTDRLSSLPQAIRIARRTGRVARFNTAFALGVKLIVFVLAFFGFASMWMAVFADVGVTILSVLNATRALRFK